MPPSDASQLHERPPHSYRWPLAVMSGVIVLVTIYANLQHRITNHDQSKYFPPFVAGWNRLKTDHLGAEYFHIAKALAKGHGFADPFGERSGPTAWMPPVLPVIQASLLWLFGDRGTIQVVVMFQALALALTGGLVLLAARTVYGHRSDWFVVPAYIVMLMLDFELAFQITHDGWFLHLMLAGMLIRTNRLRVDRSFRQTIIWGVTCGLSTLAAPVAGAVWVAITAFYWASIRRKLLIVGAISATGVLLPWTVRNYLVFDQFVPIKSNLMFDLYQSQCLTPDGLVRSDVGLSRHPYSSPDERRRHATLGERTYLRERATAFWEAVENNPESYLTRVWNRFAAATLVLVPFDRYEERWPTWLLPARAIHPLPFLAMLILLLHPRPWHRYERWAFWTYTVWLLPYVLVSYYHRYAFPLLGIKTFLVVSGAVRLPSLVQSIVTNTTGSRGPIPPTVSSSISSRDPQPSTTYEDRRRFLVGTLAIAVAIKLLAFGIDHTPLLFMGDSGAHVETALRGYVPLERSYSYGVLVRALAAWPGSFVPLIAVQSLAGAATAGMLAITLVYAFGARPGIARLAAIACCLDPLQVVHERLVLTEAFAQFLFAAHLTAVLCYAYRPSIPRLLTALVAGILLVSLRTIYLPVVWLAPIAAMGAVWIGNGFGPKATRLYSLGRHFATMVLLTVLLHGGYQYGMGALTGLPPAYLHERGFFQIAAWAPLIQPEDAQEPRTIEAIRDTAESSHPLKDRSQRDFHRWSRDGLVSRLLLAHGGDRFAASQAAGATARNAGLRDPIRVLDLGWTTYLDYFRYVQLLEHKLPAEHGKWSRFSQAQTAELRERFGWDTRDSLANSTSSKDYHLSADWYYYLLLISPAIQFVCVCVLPRQRWATGMIICSTSLLMLVTICVMASTPVVRYLSPLGYTSILTLSLAVNAIADRRRLGILPQSTCFRKQI